MFSTRKLSKIEACIEVQLIVVVEVSNVKIFDCKMRGYAHPHSTGIC